MNAPTFTPTEEQLAILAEAKSKDSLIVFALAGAAKTSTLCLLAAKLPMVPTLCCAFNKKIADEMTRRMPSHIQCATMNSLGHRAWGAKLGKRLKLDTDKGYSILSSLVESQPPEQKKKIGEVFANLLRTVRLAKANGYVPEKFRPLSGNRTLIELDEFLDAIATDIDIEPDDEFIEWFHHCLETSITLAFDGVIDFDDQVYMSVLFGGVFTKFPIIMVDETQDLSALNHEMLRKMFGGRLIAVGDPYQAIYAFRGAHIGSMALLKEEFKCKELSLSTSFRCPKAVVRRAQSRAPTMAYPAWAKEGEILHLDEWTHLDLQDGDWIICRNNAPLFSCAMKLIRAGRGVHIRGNEIGKALLKVLEKMGPKNMSREALILAIKEWEEKELKSARESRKAGIRDRAECLLVFAEFGNTLEESASYARHLFEMTGPIELMTGHKSKGLENPRVWHLDAWMIPSKFALRASEDGDFSKLDQERNLRYVIETRSQDFLGFINNDGYKDCMMTSNPNTAGNAGLVDELREFVTAVEARAPALIRQEGRTLRVSTLRAALEALTAPPSGDRETHRVGPRQLDRWGCNGCPALETEKWREPSGDGETYDRGTYAWCVAAERRSLGAYWSDQTPTPEWCPGSRPPAAPPRPDAARNSETT